ncbi:hypothetical protein SPB21_35425 [Leptothoe sp. ISB3NOV94-8A]
MSKIKEFDIGDEVYIVQSALKPPQDRRPNDHPFYYFLQEGEVLNHYVDSIHGTPTVIVLNRSLDVREGGKTMAYCSDGNCVFRQRDPIPDVFSDAEWIDNPDLPRGERIELNSPKIERLDMLDTDYVAMMADKIAAQRAEEEARYWRSYIRDYLANPTPDELFQLVYHLGKYADDGNLFSDGEMNAAYESDYFSPEQIAIAARWVLENLDVVLPLPGQQRGQ